MVWFSFIIFLFISQLTQVMQNYNCTVCDYQCDSVGRYISHCSMHKNVANLTVEYPIRTCCHILAGFSSLKTHIYRFHVENRRSLSQAVPDGLNPAVLAGISEHGDDVSEIRLKCLKIECSTFSFDTFTQLKFHLKQHLCQKGRGILSISKMF